MRAIRDVMGIKLKGFYQYEVAYDVISLSATLRRVRIHVTQIYLYQYYYNHIIEHILAKIKSFSNYHLSRYQIM